MRVAVERENGTVRLTVEDNGPGIPAEEQARVRDDLDATGQGGLAIAATLIESYGGHIRITDREPRGSVVTVELPQASETAEPTGLHNH
ncbi:sensor histidine kinase [Halosegnis sp.]|uniref:sensor histidine kinase n=1 Tax=Halosegnis sp. TaxID=2864959 RepID=UPI0035D4E007